MGLIWTRGPKGPGNWHGSMPSKPEGIAWCENADNPMAWQLPRPVRYAAASALLLLPVVLPRHIPATDLPSHLYNTWLALLVREGGIAGLEVAFQWSNVMFDWWLEALWRLAGPAVAEKAAVAAAVLIFFWGAFAWVGAVTRRPAWSSAPLIAMLAYGWCYHQGFFNYYLSCGFAFWVFACIWNCPERFLPALAAFFLAVVAHPVGAAAAGGLAAFILFTRRLGWQAKAVWAAACCVGIIGAGLIIGGGLPAQWEPSQLFHAVFATQLRPFGEKYNIFVIGLPLIWLALLWMRVRDAGTHLLGEPAIYVGVILAVAIIAIPQAVQLPGTARPLHFVDFRLGLFLSLTLQSLAAPAASPRIPLLAGLLTLLAALYFSFLAYDYRQLNHAQEEFLRAARQLPGGSRVVSAPTGQPILMNPLTHMLSKACIGHCFDYGNFAPASKAFRVRAQHGCLVVLDSSLDVDRLQAGNFTVRRRDVPLHGVFLRSANPFGLQVRPLKVGEKVPRQSAPVPPDWF